MEYTIEGLSNYEIAILITCIDAKIDELETKMEIIKSKENYSKHLMKRRETKHKRLKELLNKLILTKGEKRVDGINC